MPSGRPSDRDRRRHREDDVARHRSERVRGKRAGRSGRRPGGRVPARSSTGGAFELSSTRHAAVLALLVCAMALSVSVPLRTYLTQRAELSAQQQHKAALQRQVAKLEQRQRELSDPTYVESEARTRLGYVRPGETPYIVHVPPEDIEKPKPPPSSEPAERAWYEQWWRSLTGEES